LKFTSLLAFVIFQATIRVVAYKFNTTPQTTRSKTVTHPAVRPTPPAISIFFLRYNTLSTSERIFSRSPFSGPRWKRFFRGTETTPGAAAVQSSVLGVFRFFEEISRDGQTATKNDRIGFSALSQPKSVPGTYKVVAVWRSRVRLG